MGSLQSAVSPTPLTATRLPSPHICLVNLFTGKARQLLRAPSALTPTPRSPLAMKEANASLLSPATSSPKRNSPAAGGRYKLWALAAVILLTVWSMLTGTVTLKRSARSPSDDIGGPALEDLDILEMEERQRVVRHMWDVYAYSHNPGRIPRFWQEAFEAAYEELASDDPAARDAAVAEIARLSMRMVDLGPPPQPHKKAELEKKQKNGDVNPKSNSSSLSSVKAD